MVLPGWNVSEPVQLALQLYAVVETLKSAPDDARAFVSKVASFRRNLEELQWIVNQDVANRSSAQDLDNLRQTLIESQDCVKRCEEFGERYQGLLAAGTKRLQGVKDAARWAWQDKKVVRYRTDIDSQMNNIHFSLSVKNFTESRSRQASAVNSPAGFAPPRRADTANTITSLPPYSLPRGSWGELRLAQQQPRAPADILGLKQHHEEKGKHRDWDERPGSELDAGRFKYLLETDTKESGVTQSPAHSPELFKESKASPDFADTDEDILLRPLESRQGTETELVAGSPDSLGIFGTKCIPPNTLYRKSTGPPSTTSATSRKPSSTASNAGEFGGTMAGIDSESLEMIMENLRGVKIVVYGSKSRRLYHVTAIESHRDAQTRRRFIFVKLPTSSNSQFFLSLRSERIITHSEHPDAYGSSQTFRLKLIEPPVLKSRKVFSSRKDSDVSMASSTPSTNVSSATSVRSTTSIESPILGINDGLRIESQKHEYEFEFEREYWKFQELLMGQGVSLKAQIPIQVISSKRYEEGKLVKHSGLQNLRLWQLGRHQYLFFFCNLTTEKYKEYRLEYFKPVEFKSKTVIKLEVHLPGMIRRNSKSKSPVIISNHFNHGGSSETGLTKVVDWEELRSLDHLSIEFSSPEGKANFLSEAQFHGIHDDTFMSPFSSGSRSSTV